MIDKKTKAQFLRSELRTCALCPQVALRGKRKPPKPEPVTEVALVDVSGPETSENFMPLCTSCFRLLESERASERRNAMKTHEKENS